MSEFYSMLTTAGVAKVAALMSGESITLSQMAFGNSTLEPTESQTELHSEQHRCELTKVAIDPNAPNTLVAEAVIKSDVGGFWIREIGVYDEDGDLFAVGKYPATYKPVTTEGSVKELGVRVVLRVSNADTVIVTYNNGIMDGAANTDLSNLTFAGEKKFADKANLESPIFTGTPAAPTATPGTNTTQLATTAFVAAAIAALVNSSPAALDTLQELAAAMDNDPNFATTIMNKLSEKANIASPTFTGMPQAPTAELGTDTDQLATTAFVAAAIANYATTITNVLALKAAQTGDTITVASSNPTEGFNVRNIKAQNIDPGVGGALADGEILLVYE